MPSMPWVKLWTEMLDDPKMADLDAKQKWLFIELILVAGECDQEGTITLPMKKLAWRLRENYDQAFMDNLKALEQDGLITIDDDSTIHVVSFSKRQDRPQSVKREQWRDAQNKKRGVTGESSVSHTDVIHDTNMTHTPVIPLEEEEEEEEEEDKEQEGEQEQETDGASAGVVVVSPFVLYESEKFGTLTQKISERIGLLIDEFTEAWVSDALVKASLANKRNLAYVEGILRNWKAGGKDAPKGQAPSDDYKKYKADAKKWGYAT